MERFTMDQLFDYYIGRMPEVVDSFIANKDFSEVRYLQNKIILYLSNLKAYLQNNMFTSS